VYVASRSSLDHPLGDAVETFIRREDAERFIDEVRGDDPGGRELLARHHRRVPSCASLPDSKRHATARDVVERDDLLGQGKRVPE
jgi:hypothetical protein